MLPEMAELVGDLNDWKAGVEDEVSLSLDELSL